MPIENPPEGETPKEQRARMNRRQLLKTFIAAGGVAAASALLPNKWVKPLIEVGVLPAHAQASLTPLCYTATPSHTPTSPTPTPTCYTPTPTPTSTLRPRCYTPTQANTPTPSPTPAPHIVPASSGSSSPDHTPQPSASPTPGDRQSLLKQLLAEGRFPQDVASKLRAGEN